MGMNRKLVLAAVILILAVGVGAVVAQETGFFINITNSSGAINTAVTNSTVVENVTLTNGTLNLFIDADNISSVTINGINYTAQPQPTEQPDAAPTDAPGSASVTLTYYGQNVVPSGISGFPATFLWTSRNQMLYTGDNQTIFYTWTIRVHNLNPTQGISVPLEKILPPLASQYPELITKNITRTNNDDPWQPKTEVTNDLMPCCDITTFNANQARYCFVLFAYSPLSSEQIDAVTAYLNAQLPPAIIEWYS